jgi:hypothetical protein
MSEPIAEFDLTQEVPSAVTDAPVATVDLDAGLEAALEDFENAAAATVADPDPSLSAEPVQSKASASATESTSVESEPDFVLAEAELAPLEPGDADQFDEIFVELIEE